MNIFHFLSSHKLFSAYLVRLQHLKPLHEMTEKEFDKRMATGLAQAKADMGKPVEKAFANIRNVGNKRGKTIATNTAHISEKTNRDS